MGVGMQCYYCKRPFETGPGFIRHQAECHQRMLARQRMIKKAEKTRAKKLSKVEEAELFRKLNLGE